MRYLTCMTIAGNDPSGGAGIAADLKTFAALGCYGAPIITALTVQNTCGVTQSVPVDAQLVGEQIRAVLTDIRVDAIKIGMIGSGETACAIAEAITTNAAQQKSTARCRAPFVVLDPVLVSSSGKELLPASDRLLLLDRLFPICTMVTPNLPELLALTGTDDAIEGARLLQQHTGVPYVLVKGGHRQGTPRDILVGVDTTQHYDGPRIETRATHGTGCTLSAAIAAHVARLSYGELTITDAVVHQAVAGAKQYVTEVLRQGSSVAMGHGNGPMNHLFNPKAQIVVEDK